MAHESDTQASSESMPRVAHTIQRNGVYYFNFRYPEPLVRAGLAKTHVKFSLKTKNWRDAKTKAIREAAFHQAEIERLTHELEDGTDLHDRANPKPDLAPISELSKREQRDLILKWFVEMEKKAERERVRFRESYDPAQKEEVLEIARTDLAVYEGPETPEHHLRDEQLARFLKSEGFSMDQEKLNEDFKQLFKKAVVEVQWRTVKALEGRDFTNRDPNFAELHSNSEVQKPRHAGHTVAEICQRYPQRKSEGRISPATLTSYALPIRVLEQFFGLSTPLSSLTFEDGEALVRFLAAVPTNASKRYPGKTIQKAAASEAKRTNPKLLSPKRQKDVFLTIKGILSHAVEIGWIQRNPFASPALLSALPKEEKRQRQQFTAEELEQLFRSPRFLEWRGKRDKDGTQTEGRFWIPLLAMFLGVRANEAASLLVQDVREQDGVPFIWIRETDDAGKERKRLKTSASERRVPIHAELIKIGFLDFVDSQRQGDADGFLFPEMKPNKQTGNRAKVLSQWFGRLRKEVLGEELSQAFGKDFHCFRHSVTDCLRGLTESDERRYALLGWTDDSSKKNAGFGYGVGFALTDLKALVDQIYYPGFDPSFLYPKT